MNAFIETRRSFNIQLISYELRCSPKRHQFFQEIPIAFPIAARSCRVPLDLLYAMACTFSERVGEGEAGPWPWLLYIDKEPISFSSKATALATLRRLHGSGRTVQVGLMCLNWALLDEAEIFLCPLENLLFVARKMREYFSRNGDWWVALRMFLQAESVYSSKEIGAFERTAQTQLERLTNVDEGFVTGLPF